MQLLLVTTRRPTRIFLQHSPPAIQALQRLDSVCGGAWSRTLPHTFSATQLAALYCENLGHLKNQKKRKENCEEAGNRSGVNFVAESEENRPPNCFKLLFIL